jgi:probable HAF family extracellular repeat protein
MLTLHHVRRFALTLSAMLPIACADPNALPTTPRIATTIHPAVVRADITPLGFDVVAINDAGQVAGTLNGRAVLWTPSGSTVDLGTLGGTTSRAYAINAAGQVAGSSTTSTGETHAFLWTPGSGMQDLGTVGDGTASTARGMNDRGDVVGEVTLPPVGIRQPAKHAFLWSPGQGMQDLGTLGTTLGSTIAFDVNNAGQVVGRAFSADQQISPPTDPEYFSRGFVWTPGQGMIDVGDLGGGHSVAYAINDAGQVVGRSWLSTYIPDYGTPYRAFLWSPGQGMQDLGTLATSPSASVASAINEIGQVVGSTDTGPYFLGYGELQAFLWSPANGMDAMTPTTGIRSPRGINTLQQVIGDGRVGTVHLSSGNTPPVALPGGPYFGLEGSPVALNLSATDIDDVGFAYQVAFGDGTEESFSPPLIVRQHVYADNGTYTLTLTAIDRRGARDTKSTSVTIANVAPAILPGSLTGPVAPIAVTGGQAIATISVAFSDPASAYDTYAAVVQCGNGMTLTPNGITSPYQVTCSYTSPGVYTVRATVADEDGGTSAAAFYRYVVVYDPSGGPADGNGFIIAGDGGDRKMHFTFSAGFARSAGVPNGSVRVWGPGKQFEFESRTLEMLVVAGDWVQLSGAGYLNGVPAQFRITAVEGRGPARDADAIRIELWQGGQSVFDTQPGAARDAPVTTRLGGGNIRIRS